MEISPDAGKPANAEILVNVPRLITRYYSDIPNASDKEQKVVFGTSGHRGSSLNISFNEWHILAISQAICLYRTEHKIDGPLFMGIDTHALSEPALISALEVLAANEVDVMISQNNEYVPTPAVSLAILNYNRGRTNGLADGIVITPSHNPPSDGGFKYNTPNGGPAEDRVTGWIENKANEILKNKLQSVKRISYAKARTATSTHWFDFRNSYIKDLSSAIDFNIIRDSKIKIGVDPLGGAGVHYWGPLAEYYKIDLTVVSETVDPTFRFMTVDWDGKIRMDPSSPYAMQRLLGIKDRFDISAACDTDHDRHGIVSRKTGLLPPNHFLSVAIDYLVRNRTGWSKEASIGKTLVSSRLIDLVTSGAGRKLYESPVGFKWFVDGLFDGSLVFGGEESAGASFVRMNGKVWTTDKDGLLLALLAAEITAKTGKDPGDLYNELANKFGESVYDRVEAKADAEQKAKLAKISSEQVKRSDLGGEKIRSIITNAPGNGAPIGGVKVIADNGWFAARPSGTEDIYKIYAESFCGKDHLEQLIKEAQVIVDEAIK